MLKDFVRPSFLDAWIFMKTDHDKRVVDLPFHFALCITFAFVTFVPECKSLVNLESARFIFISTF